MADNQVQMPLGGGVYRFALGPLEVRCIEAGIAHPDGHSLTRMPPVAIGALIARTLQGRVKLEGAEEGLPGAAAFSVTELNAIIRLGLLGGGGGTTEDGKEVGWKEYDVESWMTRYVVPLSLRERWSMATAILLTLYEGGSGG